MNGSSMSYASHACVHNRVSSIVKSSAVIYLLYHGGLQYTYIENRLSLDGGSALKYVFVFHFRIQLLKPPSY